MIDLPNYFFNAIVHKGNPRQGLREYLSFKILDKVNRNVFHKMLFMGPGLGSPQISFTQLVEGEYNMTKETYEV